MTEFNQPTNPQAFPNPHRTDLTGMTLRDYFAAKAMQGMMAEVHDPNCEYIAQTAYKMADAMLKAREA
jgi:hypothetical protein